MILILRKVLIVFLGHFALLRSTLSSHVHHKTCSSNKEKQCPSFGDTQDLIECCPSKIETGDYFCCSVSEKKRTEQLNINDLDENTPEIIGIVIGSLLVIVTGVLLCCFFCSCCYLYRYRHRRRQDCVLRWANVRTSSLSSSSYVNHHTTNAVQQHIGASFLQSYHPLPILGPKPYDAPPPYPFAQQYPPFNPNGMTSTVVPFNDFINPNSSPMLQQNGTPKHA